MMLSFAVFGVSALWPPEILAKLGNGVGREVRPSWSPLRS